MDANKKELTLPQSELKFAKKLDDWNAWNENKWTGFQSLRNKFNFGIHSKHGCLSILYNLHHLTYISLLCKKLLTTGRKTCGSPEKRSNLWRKFWKTITEVISQFLGTVVHDCCYRHFIINSFLLGSYTNTQNIIPWCMNRKMCPGTSILTNIYL